MKKRWQPKPRDYYTQYFNLAVISIYLTLMLRAYLDRIYVGIAMQAIFISIVLMLMVSFARKSARTRAKIQILLEYNKAISADKSPTQEQRADFIELWGPHLSKDTLKLITDGVLELDRTEG